MRVRCCLSGLAAGPHLAFPFICLMSLLRFCPLLAGLVFSSQLAAARVKLPAVLGDNMVLQQQSDVNLWGEAKEGSQVRIHTSWNKKTYKVKALKGQWRIQVPTPPAGGPYEITFDDGDKLRLSNILIGEVWICSGQSNMEMRMKGFKNQSIHNAEAIIAASPNPRLRLFTVGRATALSPQTDVKGQWSQADTASVRSFSAVAYQFGKLLQQELGVPVGLVVTAVGGTPVQAWMSPGSLAAFPEVKIPASLEQAKNPLVQPTALFNAMVAPLLPFKAKGFLWYQGEANRSNPALYARLMPAMVQDWRRQWQGHDMPFYYVQIAPMQAASKTNGRELREVQWRMQQAIPNAGMACLLDAGQRDGIHPPDKTKPAQRLAYWALAKTYGRQDIACASPLLQRLTVQGSKALVSFDHVGKGLTAPGGNLQLFEVAGADKVFYPAQARITGPATVEVSSERVPAPVAVRYAYQEWAAGELFNSAGLPASSFRTDEGHLPVN